MTKRRPQVRMACLLLALACAITPLAPRPAKAEIPNDVVQAAKNGLDYLARSQREDGSWSGSYGQSPGVVGLCLLAFLAHGEVPGRGPYKDTIDKAIKFLLENANAETGVISRQGAQPMYNHGFATLALAEVYGMSPDPAIERVLRKAVDLIVRTQNKRGGWRYQPMPYDDDITVSGCQMIALRAADNAGISVPRKTIEKGTEYIESCYSQGGFGYQPGSSPGAARTGIGVLVLSLTGKEGSEQAARGAEYIRNNFPRPGSSYFYYTTYYCSQAMYQVGGSAWKEWDEKMTKQLLDIQVRSGGERGSWPETGSAAGRDYATAMALLALEVKWRYLPIYQR
ncbi:MAG: terpene cyclase/mutase family protein [Verrucomicrobia bacterium]|nr:terpene cyclase/mutase family protein [Verrucomicrobiota bacterium]